MVSVGADAAVRDTAVSGVDVVVIGLDVVVNGADTVVVGTLPRSIAWAGRLGAHDPR
jgi:hypothetical protein